MRILWIMKKQLSLLLTGMIKLSIKSLLVYLIMKLNNRDIQKVLGEKE